MTESFTKRGVIGALSTPGTPASSQDAAGVRVQEQRNAISLSLVSRNGRSERLRTDVATFLRRESPLAPLEGARRDDVSIFATGPLEYWVLAGGGAAINILAILQEIVAHSASVFDQSESRRTFLLSGPHVFDVLVKGTAIDLRSPSFPTFGAAHSMIAHIPALIVRRREPVACEILIPRSYAACFIAWLKEVATEYGYATVAD